MIPHVLGNFFILFLSQNINKKLFQTASLSLHTTRAAPVPNGSVETLGLDFGTSLLETKAKVRLVQQAEQCGLDCSTLCVI